MDKSRDVEGRKNAEYLVVGCWGYRDDLKALGNNVLVRYHHLSSSVVSASSFISV